MKAVYETRNEVAKAIRGELKAKFPGVKFSVKGGRGTGYSALDVGWTDGPTEGQVGAVVGKYKLGNFDGMTDSYHYDATHVVAEDGEIMMLGGVKYLFTKRDFSDEVTAKTLAAFKPFYCDSWETTPPEERELTAWRALKISDLRGVTDPVPYFDEAACRVRVGQAGTI